LKCVFINVTGGGGDHQSAQQGSAIGSGKGNFFHSLFLSKVTIGGNLLSSFSLSNSRRRGQTYFLAAGHSLFLNVA
jgi:hypothetical protein